MPQMFPILWTLLFMATSTSILLMLSLIFFSLKPLPSKTSLLSNKTESIWKW